MRTSISRVAAVAATVAVAAFGPIAPVREGAAAASAVPTLTLSNSSLLFDPDGARLDFASSVQPSGPVAWSVADVRGQTVRSGTSVWQGSTAVADLTSLPEGYYDVTATTDPSGSAALHAAFGVVDPIPADARATASPFGVNIHQLDPRLISAVARIGIAHARKDASWTAAEQSPGVYTFPTTLTDGLTALRAAGIDPLVISDYDNPFYDGGRTPSSPTGLAAYGAYTAAVSSRFRSLGGATEVYNEPNNTNFNTSACGATAACYAQLLDAAAKAVHSQDPSAPLVGPALSGAPEDFVHDVLAAGGADSLSAVSVHPYRTDQAPEGIEDQAASMAALIKSTAGRTIPLWFTELGWPTSRVSDPTQADYLIRAAVLSTAGGASRIYAYDAENDGTDPTKSQDTFGLFESPSAVTPNAIQPKPSAIAQAVAAVQLAGARLQSRDQLDGSTYSYVYGSASRTTRVMWTSGPSRDVAIRTTSPVVLTDEYGTHETLSPLRGSITLQLTGRPVYLQGAVQRITLDQRPPVTIQAAPSVAEGDSVRYAVTLDRTGLNCLRVPASVTVEVDGQPQRLDAPLCRRTTALVQEPTHIGQDQTWADGNVLTSDGHIVGEVASAPIAITPPVIAQARLSLTRSGRSYGQQASIVVTNTYRSQNVALNGITWTVGTASGSIDDSRILAPGQQVTHVLDIPGLTLWKQQYLNATVNLQGRDPIAISQSVGIGPIEPDGHTTVPPIDLATDTDWVAGTSAWGGPSDLGGTVAITQSRDGLHLHAAIQDDVFRQVNGPGSLYNGDSIQLSLSPEQPGQTNDRTEIGLALTPSGPAAQTFSAFGTASQGATPTTSLSVTRSGTVTTYDVDLPWQSLGLESAPSGTFALSFIVSDDDGSGRKGYLEWSSGIGRSKNTSQHFPVELSSVVRRTR